MTDKTGIAEGIMAPGEYSPAGEAQGTTSTFSAEQVGRGFDVAVDRVYRAMEGEFGLAPSAQVTSHQAQHLAEVILGDQPLANREAALMQLGAFTPRSDHDWGVGEAAPNEESDRVAGDDDHISQH